MEEEVGSSSEAFVEIDWNNVEDEVPIKCSLIGKLMSSKSVNRSTMRNMLIRGWNVKDFKITEMENNIFLFSFEKESDRSRILRNRPWTVTGILLVIQEWSSLLPISEVKWNFCPYWIQFHGVPPGGLSGKNARTIGERIGDVLEVEDPIRNGKICRDFMRARVLVDISKPLLCGVWIPRPNMEKVWISFRYEKLHVFCYKCGIVSHDFRDCKERRAMLFDDPGKPKFGGWLGTHPLKSRIESNDNWRWRSAEDLKEEEYMRDKKCNSSVNFEMYEANSVHSEGAGGSNVVSTDCGNFNTADVNVNVVLAETSTDMDLVNSMDELVDINVRCSEGSKRSGDGKDIISTFSETKTKFSSDESVSNLSLTCSDAIWDKNGYFVEFPPDKINVDRKVALSQARCAFLTDKLRKVSLKRKFEEDSDCLESKRSKRDFFF